MSYPKWKQRIWENAERYSVATTPEQIEAQWATIAERCRANGAASLTAAIRFLRTEGRVPTYYRKRLAPYFGRRN